MLLACPLCLCLCFLCFFSPCVDAVQGSVAAGRKRVGLEQEHIQAGTTVSFLKTLNFKYSLRVCNAYAATEPMELYVGTEKLTTDGPMPYGGCRDLKQHVMKQDDRFDFKIGDSSVGTFLVSSLPSNDAVLLLVVHRRDAESNAGAFESHVFSSNLPSGQIAVVDTYKGEAGSNPELTIRDHVADAADKTTAKSRKEVLKYDTVVAVRPGKYDLALGGENQLDNKPFKVLGGESYVILRAGFGSTFPQALTVFPVSEGAARQGKVIGGITIILVAASCMISAFLQL